MGAAILNQAVWQDKLCRARKLRQEAGQKLKEARRLEYELRCEHVVVRTYDWPTDAREATIVEAVCLEFHIDGDLRAPDRHAHIVLARQIAAWLLRRICGYSYPHLGVVLGRDHATIMYACRMIDARPGLQPLLRRLEAQITAMAGPTVDSRPSLDGEAVSGLEGI
jgi:Bacterial dnaA protein helix-turn-helix